MGNRRHHTAAAEQMRYDLSCEVLALGNDVPVDFETVLDAEFDRGAKFATEAAAILAYDMESASEYALRVQEWLRGLIAKHITDEAVKAYEKRCDADLAVELDGDERRAA